VQALQLIACTSEPTGVRHDGQIIPLTCVHVYGNKTRPLTLGAPHGTSGPRAKELGAAPTRQSNDCSSRDMGDAIRSPTAACRRRKPRVRRAAALSAPDRRLNDVKVPTLCRRESLEASHGHDGDTDVIVMWPGVSTRYSDEAGLGGQLGLKPGERLRFGFSPRSGAFEPKTARKIGELVASNDHWSLTNYTSNSTFVVENLEGGSEVIKVGPRRQNVIVPFEMSRALFPVKNGLTELKIFGTPPNLLTDEAVVDAPPISTRLDEASKYFFVLVALCEPRLRGSSMAAVPSVQEVVERLRCLEQFKDANRSSINYHVDYLRERKLPVKQWATSFEGGRLHSKREALVSFALRFDIVTSDHLMLLPKSPFRRVSGQR